MRAAGIGIIVQEYVAFVDILTEFLHYLGRRVRNRENVAWIIGLALRDQAAICGDQCAGEIVPFVDDRGKRAANHVCPHLVDNGDK